MARRCRQVPFLSAKKVSQRGRGCARNSVSRSSPVNSIQDRTLTRSAGHSRWFLCSLSARSRKPVYTAEVD